MQRPAIPGGSWVERSEASQTLVAGRRIEVQFKGNNPEGSAEWIKVQAIE